MKKIIPIVFVMEVTNTKIKDILLKQIIALLFCGFVCHQAIAQLCSSPTGCTIINNGDFSQGLGSAPFFNNAFNLGQVPCWTASHGTPDIMNDVPFAPGSSSHSAHMWSNGATSPVLGEGITTNINIQQGKLYVLSYYIRRDPVADGDPNFTNTVDFFKVKLTNSATSGFPINSGNSGDPIPNPPQQLLDQVSSFTSTSWILRTVCFKVNGNFNQLWLHPEQSPTHKRAAVWVDNIRIDRLPDAGPDYTICQGTNKILGLNLCSYSGATYSWSPSAGLSCITCLNPVANPSVTTTYTLTVTSSTGCVLTDEVVITVRPNPTADAGPDITLCPSGCRQIGNYPLCPPGVCDNWTYSWSPLTDLSGASITPTVCNNANFPENGRNYTVTVTNEFGCTAKDVVRVYSFKCNPSVANIPYCPGSSVQIGHINQPGVTNYSWSPTNYLSCSPCARPLANPPSSTTYWNDRALTYINSNGGQDQCNCHEGWQVYPDINVCGFVAKQSNPISSTISDAMSIYPNPFNNNFTLLYDGEGEIKIEVMDVLGKTLLSQQSMGKEEINLKMDDAPQGIYLVKITSGADVVMKKVIKE